MDNTKKILTEIDSILDQIIDIATRLKLVSQGVIAKEEVSALQNTQAELLQKLLLLEEDQKKEDLSNDPAAIELRTTIQQKLVLFEELNASFIENIASHRKPIYLRKETEEK